LRFPQTTTFWLPCPLNKVISIWHIKTGQEHSHWSYNGSVLNRFCFSPDGKLLAGGNTNSVRVWVTATGKPLLQLDGQVIMTMAFSPSDRMFAAAGFPPMAAGGGLGESAPICLWDTLTGEEIRKFQFATRSVYGLAFAPDGRTLASGGGDSSILLGTSLAKRRESSRSRLR
jgi:WD40 repeat protein